MLQTVYFPQSLLCALFRNNVTFTPL